MSGTVSPPPVRAALEHLAKVILPWWEREALDTEPGVRTCFDNRGHLLSTDRLTWSQGRWAWVTAEIALDAQAGALAPWIPVQESALWGDRSRRTAEFLVRNAVISDGRTRFRLDEHGNRPVGTTDEESASSVFADLFAVLGISGALRAPVGQIEVNREELLTTAALVLSSARDRIVNHTARTEPYPVPREFVDLASPMTLLHTGAEAARAGVPGARRIAHEAWEELVGPDGMLFSSGWWEFRPLHEEDRDTLLARHVTPGHLLELLWMLLHAADQDESLQAPAWLPDLALQALEIGWDEKLGGVFRYADREGGQPRGRLLGGRYEALVQSTWDTKLWWVHAEALYGARVLGARYGRRDLLEWADRIQGYVDEIFPDPDGAEWIQIRSRDGSPHDAVVALPVKDPFHIIRALVLLDRLERHQADDSPIHP